MIYGLKNIIEFSIIYYLVANLMIHHSVNTMTKVIRKLNKEGLEITDEMLSALAPYRRNHIDLLGKYPLRVDRRKTRQALKLF